MNELQEYENFDELALDILEMAHEFMPDKTIFLSAISETEQIILKVLHHNCGVHIDEGMTLDLPDTVCNRINFIENEPLVYEDMKKESRLVYLRKTLLDANINSYLGVPIKLGSGETFGTLCAVDTSAASFSRQSIKMFQRIAKMFSYYLDLERKAYRDSLTGLYNREFLYKSFRSETEGALFFIDLDGFKSVNDRYGHDTGDLVLKETASRLKQYIKTRNGMAVRLGGDEFVLNVQGGADHSELSLQAELLMREFADWSGFPYGIQISASIGIAAYGPDHHGDLKKLLKAADDALYETKEKGKNGFRIY
nr:sensor domain-containing diguanylate cyclase [Metabacillus kandeliae]